MITPDPPASSLLIPQKLPVLVIRQLLLINPKTLPARRASLRQLRNFYEGLLGLTYSGEVATPHHYPAPLAALSAWKFIFEQSTVLLQPPDPLAEQAPDPSEEPIRELELTVLHFPTALSILTQRSIPYILERSTTFTRCAFIQDPAANWLALHETRPF